MGDFPLMTDKGTFIINGTERVVVSQLVRSPGVYFEQHRRQDLRQGHLRRQDHPAPRRLAGVRDRQEGHRRRPHRPQAQAAGHRAAQGARLRTTRGDPRAVRQLRVDRSARSRRTTSPRPATRRSSTSTASCARASRRRVEAAQTLLDNFYFNPQALRPGQGRPLQGQQEARPRRCRSTQSDAHRRGHRARRSSTSCACTPARPSRRPERRRYASRPTTSTTSATAACARSASSSRTRSASGLSRMERVVRERMTTQDVEAITPQTLINIRPVVASIKEFFGIQPAVAVHGPDQPARRA